MNEMMKQLEVETPAAGLLTLQDSFRVFNRVTQDLEAAYRGIESRAERIEGRLSRANHALSNKVRELSQVTRELNGVLEAMPSGVVVASADGTLVRVNAAAETLLGRPAAELLGRAASALRGADREPLLLLGRAASGPDDAAVRRVVCLDGSIRHLQGSVVPLADGGFVEVLSDRTEVAHLRSQVHRLDTLAALGEMAAGVAHEIRNPMNGVEGFAGLLERALAPGEALSREQLGRYADRIRQGVAEVNAIITDLLLWARPERLMSYPVTLARLMEEVVADQRATRIDGGMADVHVTPVPVDLTAPADRLKLKLVLGNLLRNACEAAGAMGHVVVSVVASAASVDIHVDDDGPGIAGEIVDRLFTPFATTKASGTGLGLAIARKLVELHGGRLAAGQGPLGGARFTLTLPRTGISR